MLKPFKTIHHFKGPVIIYQVGGVGGLGGDHLIFRRTEGGDQS